MPANLLRRGPLCEMEERGQPTQSHKTISEAYTVDVTRIPYLRVNTAAASAWYWRRLADIQATSSLAAWSVPTVSECLASDGPAVLAGAGGRRKVGNRAGRFPAVLQCLC